MNKDHAKPTKKASYVKAHVNSTSQKNKRNIFPSPVKFVNCSYDVLLSDRRYTLSVSPSVLCAE